MACQDAEGTNRDGAPCFTKDIQMNIICVSEEPGDKYRVQQTVDGLVEIVLFFVYIWNERWPETINAVPQQGTITYVWGAKLLPKSIERKKIVESTWGRGGGITSPVFLIFVILFFTALSLGFLYYCIFYNKSNKEFNS